MSARSPENLVHFENDNWRHMATTTQNVNSSCTGNLATFVSNITPDDHIPFSATQPSSTNNAGRRPQVLQWHNTTIENGNAPSTDNFVPFNSNIIPYVHSLQFRVLLQLKVYYLAINAR